MLQYFSIRWPLWEHFHYGTFALGQPSDQFNKMVSMETFLLNLFLSCWSNISFFDREHIRIFQIKYDVLCVIMASFEFHAPDLSLLIAVYLLNSYLIAKTYPVSVTSLTAQETKKNICTIYIIML